MVSVLQIQQIKIYLFQGVAPLLIKQVINMPDKGAILFGQQFGIVSLVAIVRNIEHSSTKITYTVEDSTGRIDAHLWLEEGDTMNSPTVLLNTYARVFGSVRTQGGGKTIMIFKIEPLESLNGLTTHLLEVLNTRYGVEDIANNGVRLNNTKVNNGNGGQQQQQQQAVDNGLQGKEKLIYEAVKAYKGDQGMSVQDLQAKFSHISASDLQ